MLAMSDNIEVVRLNIISSNFSRLLRFFLLTLFLPPFHILIILYVYTYVKQNIEKIKSFANKKEPPTPSDADGPMSLAFQLFVFLCLFAVLDPLRGRVSQYANE